MLAATDARLFESCRSISKLMMSKLVWTVLVTEGNIQSSFRDINTNKPVEFHNFVVEVKHQDPNV